MCGRYVAATPSSVLADELDVDDVVLPDGELAPRWNVAPTTPVYAVAEGRDGRRRLGTFVWGFRGGRDSLLFNARAETLLDRVSFREAFLTRRCLVPADGFYEWRDRHPVHIRRRDHGRLVFAGLWQRVGDHRACTIVTTEANATVAGVHDRMPVVLDPLHWRQWLDRGEHDGFALTQLLRPAPEDLLEWYAVDPLVNDVRRDGPELIAPAAEPPPEQPSLL